jgi:hypothetical protein
MRRDMQLPAVPGGSARLFPPTPLLMTERSHWSSCKQLQNSTGNFILNLHPCQQVVLWKNLLNSMQGALSESNMHVHLPVVHLHTCFALVQSFNQRGARLHSIRQC